MKERCVKNEYKCWVEHVAENPELEEELKSMGEKEIREAFSQNLSFGTGGIRGIMGAGTNRINIYTVGKVTKGVVAYIRKYCKTQNVSVVVGYDTRINSRLFAERVANIFSSQKIKVYLFDEPTPTPMLSFAIRELGCVLGVVITASHNPAIYNGYKVYDEKGCQITRNMADRIIAEIQKVDIFSVDSTNEDVTDMICSVPYDIQEDYILQVVEASMIAPINEVDKNIAIIYSPLNGTGLKSVLMAFKKAGFSQIEVVREQKDPDGRFPTCPKPNPEESAAMELGLEYCKHQKADVFVATDPDCDRVAIAVRTDKGDYLLMNTNEVGVLLLDYICSVKNKESLRDMVFMKTVVTTDMAELIAHTYGIRVINTLTGFKYIGEQICELEKRGRKDDFLFAFEESCGYLSGTYVRDKDGVNAALLICDMIAYHKKRGRTILTRLEELYRQYGYCMNVQKTYCFEGIEGERKMNEIMQFFRKEWQPFGTIQVGRMQDYREGIDGLPKTNMIKYNLIENGGTVTLRPSGTEPKLKVYFSLMAEDEKQAETIRGKIEKEIEKCLESKVEGVRQEEGI